MPGTFGTREELSAPGAEPKGAERWYAFSIYLPGPLDAQRTQGIDPEWLPDKSPESVTPVAPDESACRRRLTKRVPYHDQVRIAGTREPRWIVALYRDILGRGANPDGLALWMRRRLSGTLGVNVALGFAYSVESPRRMATDLYIWRFRLNCRRTT